MKKRTFLYNLIFNLENAFFNHSISAIKLSLSSLDFCLVFANSLYVVIVVLLVMIIYFDNEYFVSDSDVNINTYENNIMIIKMRNDV